MNNASENPSTPALSNVRHGAFETDEINLYELISHLLGQWKVLLLATTLGLLAGTLAWYVKGYETELKARPVAKLNFVEWRKITSGLPALAENRRDALANDPAKVTLYDMLSNPNWWSKNVLPAYRYSKSDLKELGNLSKQEQEEGATAIEYVTFRANARNSADGVKIARGTEFFIQEGGLFLALKSMLAHADLSTSTIFSQTQAKISKAEMNLDYLYKRSSAIKILMQKHPEKAGATIQSVLDPKETSSRFLPLSTQLIAVKTQIHDAEEALSRDRDQLEEARTIRKFLDKATPLLNSEPNGFALAQKLSAIETEVRREIDLSNKAQLIAINQIAFELDSTHKRFTALFESDTLTSTLRPSRLTPMALGLIGGLFSGVLLVLILSAWQRAKRGCKRSPNS